MAALVPTSQMYGRSEVRIPLKLAAELSHPDAPVLKERVSTENVSPHGARVTTVRRWQPGTHVLVTFLWNGVRSEGRVTYCQRMEGDDFAIGVELSGQLQSRMGNLT